MTTIGRGGTDASAIMLKIFKAEKCIIYTDVDGVYTTDPRMVPKAKKKKFLTRDVRNGIT